MRDPFGLGVVGLGPWAIVLAEAVARSDALRLHSCSTRDRARAEAFAARFACEAAPSFEALLAHPRVQGVIIATPNHLHAPQAIQAARAGKHVFVEKPLAVTVEEGEAVLGECRRSRVTLAVGHEFRRLGSHRAVRRLLDGGGLGTLLTVEVHLDMPRGRTLPAADWRADPQCLPGGPLSQLGTHLADTLAYLGGPVAEVMALTARRASPVATRPRATAASTVSLAPRTVRRARASLKTQVTCATREPPTSAASSACTASATAFSPYMATAKKISYARSAPVIPFLLHPSCKVSAGAELSWSTI